VCSEDPAWKRLINHTLATRQPAWMPSSYVPAHSNPYMNNPPTPQHNPSPQHQLQTQRVVIPNDLVGCIIGKGGSKINEIRHMSGSQIKIMEPGATITGVDSGPDERLIVIVGSLPNIQTAVQLLYHVRDTTLVASSLRSSHPSYSAWSKKSRSKSGQDHMYRKSKDRMYQRAPVHQSSLSLFSFSHIATCSPTCCCFLRLA
jgi:hypothetical protein